MREAVDKNYSLNRAAFYAYGSYLKTYQQNPLKKIFRTELFDISKVALSFGFNTPPRIKEGKFVNSFTMKSKKLKKLKSKEDSKKEKDIEVEKEEVAE